jgi:hypothetical protein
MLNSLSETRKGQRESSDALKKLVVKVKHLKDEVLSDFKKQAENPESGLFSTSAWSLMAEWLYLPLKAYFTEKGDLQVVESHTNKLQKMIEAKADSNTTEQQLALVFGDLNGIQSRVSKAEDKITKELRAFRYELEDAKDLSGTQQPCELLLDSKGTIESMATDIANLNAQVKALHNIGSEVNTLRQEFSIFRDSAADGTTIRCFPEAFAAAMSMESAVKDGDGAASVNTLPPGSQKSCQNSSEISQCSPDELVPRRPREGWTMAGNAVTELVPDTVLEQDQAENVSRNDGSGSPNPMTLQQESQGAPPILQSKPFFTSPEHPEEAHSRALTLELEKEILAALRRPTEEKRILVKKLNLKMHPDKTGSEDAFKWFQQWKEVHYDWFLGRKA